MQREEGGRRGGVQVGRGRRARAPLRTEREQRQHLVVPLDDDAREALDVRARCGRLANAQLRRLGGEAAPAATTLGGGGGAAALAAAALAALASSWAAAALAALPRRRAGTRLGRGRGGGGRGAKKVDHGLAAHLVPRHTELQRARRACDRVAGSVGGE